MAPPFRTIELERDPSSRSSSQHRSGEDYAVHSNISSSPNSLKLMTELEKFERELDSPDSYHSNRQNGSPSDFLGLKFRPRARGSSFASQISEREPVNEAAGSPHPLVGKERFDTTPVDYMQPEEHDDASFQDNDRDERFSNPVKYFEDLDDLEEDLINHSSLKIHDGQDTFKCFSDSSELSSVIMKSDDELLDLCKNHESMGYAQTALHLLQCRNIVFGVYDNCSKLTEAEFGGHRINFVRLDRHRSNVAELIHYDASSIKSLAGLFDHALSDYLQLADDHKFAPNALRRLNQACADCLMELGLWNWEMSSQPDEVKWYSVCQTLDLALLSFIGAHNQNFAKFLNNQPESFDIPSSKFQLPVQIIVRRRHFQCLDKLFSGKPVWVFHPGSKTAVADEPLYLSANMKSFSHIWGPVWAVSASGHVKSGVQRYDVGGGSIMPWQQSSNYDLKLLEGEILCHWLPYEEKKDERDSMKTLCEDDVLLIGANVRLRPNDENCPYEPEDLMQQLRDSNSLHDLGTSEATYYVDSQSSAISLGGWGLNVSGSRSFKRRDGQTLKSALLDQWDHDRDGNNMLKDLKKGYGVEMSFCSLNARRTPIFNLLRTEDMSKYLRALDWEDERCAIRVLEILQNETVQDLQQTYKRRQDWRKDIRDIVLHALHLLAKCTVDESTNELSIPWIVEDSVCSTAFSQRDISWTGFLQDTRESSTFGLLTNKCLSFNQPGGRACGQDSGSPVLQTSLRINTSMKQNYMYLKQRSCGEYFWSISAIKKKQRFPLGSRGSLTVVGMVGRRAALLMEWRSEVETKKFVKRALRWNGGRHHEELIRAKWATTERPIQIFIASKYQVPAIPKRHRKHRQRKLDTTESDDYFPSSSVPQIKYTLDSLSDVSPRSRWGSQIFRVESESSAPISIPSSSSRQSRHDKEISMDISSDDGSPESVRNQWKWDKNYKLWRKHVYTGDELDYTMWTRNPDLFDS